MGFEPEQLRIMFGMENGGVAPLASAPHAEPWEGAEIGEGSWASRGGGAPRWSRAVQPPDRTDGFLSGRLWPWAKPNERVNSPP